MMCLNRWMIIQQNLIQRVLQVHQLLFLRQDRMIALRIEEHIALFEQCFPVLIEANPILIKQFTSIAEQEWNPAFLNQFKR